MSESSDPVAFSAIGGRFRAKLGESPIWSAREGCVWWVDIDGALLCRTDIADATTRSWPTPERPGFVVLTDPHGLAVGMESGIFAFDPAQASFTRIVTVDQPGHRFNDATVDWTGRLWAGSMALDATQPTGVLYSIDADRKACPAILGLRTANGLAADERRARLYLSDTNPAVQRVWTLPLDPVQGLLGERSLFADFTALAGRPDGAAMDRDGNYWVAGVGGAVLHRFAPDGLLLESHRTPCQAPTKPAFIGPALDRLVLTSKGGDAADDGSLAISGPIAPPGQPVPAWRIGGM